MNATLSPFNFRLRWCSRGSWSTVLLVHCHQNLLPRNSGGKIPAVASRGSARTTSCYGSHADAHNSKMTPFSCYIKGVVIVLRGARTCSWSSKGWGASKEGRFRHAGKKEWEGPRFVQPAFELAGRTTIVVVAWPAAYSGRTTFDSSHFFLFLFFQAVGWGMFFFWRVSLLPTLVSKW